MQSVLFNGVIGYLIIINVIAFCVFGIDKNKAKRKQWRIPEATLIGLAVLGGSAGALLGMRLFHHKTKKPKFFIGVPVIIAIQIALIGFCYHHLGIRTVKAEEAGAVSCAKFLKGKEC